VRCPVHSRRTLLQQPHQLRGLQSDRIAAMTGAAGRNESFHFG